MSKIPEPLFVQLANACVPALRAQKADFDKSFGEGAIGGVSISLTATLPVDGVESRVRVTLELDPEEEDEDGNEIDDDEDDA